MQEKNALEETTSSSSRRFSRLNPSLLKRQIQTVLRNIGSRTKTKSVKAEDLIDDSVLRNFEESGFVGPFTGNNFEKQNGTESETRKE